MKYRVGDFRDLGLEAKWTRTGAGAPIIAVRKPGTKTWCAVTGHLFKSMSESDDPGEKFDQGTALVDIFSIPA